MSVSGTYYVKMWIPNPALVHGMGESTGGPAAAGGPTAAGGPAAPGCAAEKKPAVELKDHGTPVLRGGNDVSLHTEPGWNSVR